MALVNTALRPYTSLLRVIGHPFYSQRIHELVS